MHALSGELVQPDALITAAQIVMSDYECQVLAVKMVYEHLLNAGCRSRPSPAFGLQILSNSCSSGIDHSLMAIV